MQNLPSSVFVDTHIQHVTHRVLGNGEGAYRLTGWEGNTRHPVTARFPLPPCLGRSDWTISIWTDRSASLADYHDSMDSRETAVVVVAAVVAPAPLPASRVLLIDLSPRFKHSQIVVNFCKVSQKMKIKKLYLCMRQ